MKKTRTLYGKNIIRFIIILLSVFLSGCDGVITHEPTINSFSASPPTITEGESSTLSWTVADATSVTIDHAIGSVAVSTGTYSVSPTETTVYTLTAANSAGSVTAMTTVTVNPPAITYGSIDISSSPDGAKVYLDGVDTGSITPITLTGVSAGEHAITLELFHYKTKEDDVLVTAGETTYLNWALTYASTVTLTLQPGTEGKDAYVVSTPTYSNSNFNEAYAWAGNWGTEIVRAYLQFDLGTVPGNAVVTSAILRLYQFDLIGSGDFSLGIYKVTDDWDEGDLTWNNQPSSSSEAEDSRTISTTTDIWRSWYIDTLVQGWLDGNIENDGMLLKAADEEAINTKAGFRTSDYIVDSSKSPKLEIQYYIP